MKKLQLISILLCLLAAPLSVAADDYTTFLTNNRGFTEVTSTAGFTGNADDYYILTSAETTGLIVGIGAYEAKPDWASTESKALRYKSAATDPILDLTNFFTIEKSGQYIGLRNVVYSADMFQTHNDAGFMYVNTYTDKNFDEWSYLIPSYQSGYWLFENGKYPMSSTAQWKGFMGSWTPGRLEVGEPIALNRLNTANDIAGHYRLFRITKDDLLAQQRQALCNASPSNPLNATWLITNPSFETGDETGWTFINRGDGNNDFKVCDFGMSNKDGNYLMNGYQWWATNLGVSQTVTDIPSGEYTLSAVVATWENRTAYFTANATTITQAGTNDATGIPVSIDVNIGTDSKLTIRAGSTGQWWVEGHEGETQTFFKLDNVQLTCKRLYLNGIAKPLPNDETTALEADQWYYYEVKCTSGYWLIGNLSDMVYSLDGDKLPADISTSAVDREMTLSRGRIYFKTTRSDATLKVVAKREIIESSSSFTACALNVDGLPDQILFVTLNPDGPQSDGTKKISTYLNNKGYDLIGFSEDFNFDTELKSNISGYTWGTFRGKITGLTNSTDGLEFACKNSSLSFANETYVKYDSKSSTDGNQYINKGYRHYDVTFEGQLIDVYITHMDAGDNDAAKTSRNKQWKQLTEAINAVDNGREAPRPKLVIGDTNCRWTRDGVKANFLDLLSSDFTASDVWVEFYLNGIYPTMDMADLTDQSDPTYYTNYEIVDKIIYINPKAANTLQLVPQSFRIEQDYIYDTIDHDGNTKALGDHNPVVVEFKYIRSGNEVPLTLDLANNATDNSTAIANANGATANVTLSGRTLYKDGSWNTICLPFNLTLAGSPLAGATAKTLTAATMTGTHVDLTFGDDVTELVAGTPYIIKWTSGEDIYEPVFNGVTLSATTPATVGFDNNHIQFIGYYDAFNITAADEDIFYMTADDQLKSTAIDRTLKSCRAYFHFTPNNGYSVKALTFSLNFGDEDGIKDLSKRNHESATDHWYDLGGRQIEQLPIHKGIYIKDGKKVVIK